MLVPSTPQPTLNNLAPPPPTPPPAPVAAPLAPVSGPTSLEQARPPAPPPPAAPVGAPVRPAGPTNLEAATPPVDLPAAPVVPTLSPTGVIAGPARAVAAAGPDQRDDAAAGVQSGRTAVRGADARCFCRNGLAARGTRSTAAGIVAAV